MGDGLYHPLVHAKGVLDQLLPVAGDGAADNLHPAAAEVIDLLQLFLHQLHRVPLVGAVICIEQLLVLAQQAQFGGGAAAVDAQPRPAAVLPDVQPLHIRPGVALAKRLVVRLICKQGRQTVGHRPLRQALLNGGSEVRHGHALPCLPGIQRCAVGHSKAAVLREHGLLVAELQCLLEALPEALAVVERATQKQHLAADLPALGQTCDGLVHHRLVDAGGHVLLVGPLVQEGLDVALGKHAAAAGDGVDAGVAQAQLVHLIHCDVQEGGHLIDKGPGATGAGAVHPLLHTAVEEDDLGVLAPQLDHRGGIRLQALHHLAGSEHLLDKGDPHALRKAQPGAAGQGHGKGAVPDEGGRLLQQFQCLLPHLGHVALVLLVEDLLPFQQHHFHCGAAHIDAQGQLLVLIPSHALSLPRIFHFISI